MRHVSLLIKPASSLCNMRCRYCFYADVSEHRTVNNYGLMAPDVQEKMVENAFRTATESVSFAFQGGEPTLAGLEYFRRHVRLCKKYQKPGIRVSQSVQTNGLLLDDEWAAFFAENQFLVGLSLDGPKEIHDANRRDAAGKGTFPAVMEAGRLLKKHGVPFNILCVVDNTVARNANQVLNFFLQNGFFYLQFIPCLDELDFNGETEPRLSAQAYLRFLLTSVRKYVSCFWKGTFLSIRNLDNYVGMLLNLPPESCAMNGRCSAYFVVEGDGSVYPCDFYVLDRYKMGNVAEQSFQEMYDSELCRKFVAESLWVDPACKQCPWYALCRGGCRREREPFREGKPGLNRFCETYRKFFEQAVPQLEYVAAELRRRSGGGACREGRSM